LKWIWRLLWFIAGHQLKGGVVRRARRFGVLAYLRALEGSRKVLIVALIAFFALNTIMLAGAGALVSGVYLLNVEPQTKLTILFATCATLFFLPLIVIAIALSGRVWYKISGAKRMVEDLGQRGA
jgi:hypothetical protein